MSKPEAAIGTAGHFTMAAATITPGLTAAFRRSTLSGWGLPAGISPAVSAVAGFSKLHRPRLLRLLSRSVLAG